MRLIPAIDIIDGKCVRLKQGDYDQKTVYNEDPLTVAKEFEASGIQYLHLVDLEGAKSGHIINHKVLESIAANTKLHIDFGGGVKSDEDIRKAFDYGAKQVTCGSVAVKNSDLVAKWIQEYGPKRLILGADVKEMHVAINGWTKKTKITIFDLIKDYIAMGLEYVICTDIAMDGMLAGPSFELYKNLLSTFTDIRLIASGGVGHIEDVKKLKDLNMDGVIIGKAIYEQKITLQELSDLQHA
ncbi:1-(5-phosphoribosyl)-5-[(5-phosphoribosylamino)methylideneamino]imidazole-4-carboxamide isomerase [Fulvivirga sp. M361]|uniref:1-(5-phosphoribosyl)-5-[(5- phosphoribosylamino)methylideneamino]imidazole-4- carboxamide isomerase n=1 Tax=Fulvivirga sp. M361 TaxID=2594266 RepID=UPI00117A9787|nr:1-(5-phosphoribosyl)-5-[(5-phosphoribosylamino)methylideneamino]imidazole-4-carboxamide isomerase [Fulvivirga sp. M361]TRX52366.1 1-(5-phosphoribosyl)-5-[(5-phosphoribosylamino)methylideneamino]imidazole-4-carboxamide isomerase [Fulvivirga sp. M361]